MLVGAKSARSAVSVGTQTRCQCYLLICGLLWLYISGTSVVLWSLVCAEPELRTWFQRGGRISRHDIYGRGHEGQIQ